jgi:hypothetical protein
LLLPVALLLIAARASPPPSGDLMLDAADPVISVEIAGVPLRLRVDLDRQNDIELNPAAAARLPLLWETGSPLDVGRVRLSGRLAAATMTVGGRIVPAQIADHGRDCCVGADGAIGPDLLPYASVSWRRTQAPPSDSSLTLPMTASATTGLSVPADISGVRLRFALGQEESVGTAAAGAALASAWDGRWNGSPRHIVLAFGISRPARMIDFARPGLLAGFRFDRLLVRISDFSGDAKLPTDPDRADDVVVSHHLARQQAWSAVIIGADRLFRCAEITYRANPRSLTLHCAFDAP